MAFVCPMREFSNVLYSTKYLQKFDRKIENSVFAWLSGLKATVYDLTPGRAGKHARNFMCGCQGKLVC